MVTPRPQLPSSSSPALKAESGIGWYWERSCVSDGAGVLAAICRMKRHERLEIGGTKAELDRLSGGRKLQQDRLTVRGHAALDELDRRKIDAVLLHDR